MPLELPLGSEPSLMQAGQSRVQRTRRCFGRPQVSAIASSMPLDRDGPAALAMDAVAGLRSQHCPHSANVNNVALPPAAVVLMVRVRSVAKRSR